MKKKWMGILLTMAVAVGSLTGCNIPEEIPFWNTNKAEEVASEDVSVQDSQESVGEADSEKTAQELEAEELLTHVRILNDEPDMQENYEALAEQYEKETGIQTEVILATDDVYQTVLDASIAQEKPVTVFFLHSKDQVDDYSDYCDNLTDSFGAQNVINDSFLVKNSHGEVKALALTADYYGLVYNKDYLNLYMGLKDAVVSDVSEIDSFEKLKSVASDMQKRASEIKKKSGAPFKGAFTSTFLDASSGWKYSRLLLNYAIFYEEQDGMGVFSKSLKGKYMDQYKNVLDMMLSNASCDSEERKEKSGGSAVKEFAAGEAAFLLAGNWNYEMILGSGKIMAHQIGMMPVHFSEDNTNEGLGILNARYACVNQKAKERDREASVKFLDWCIQNTRAQKILMEDMGYTLPYQNIEYEELTNVLTRDAIRIAKSGAQMLDDRYALVPSREWEKAVNDAIKAYVQEDGDWSDAKKAFADH